MTHQNKIEARPQTQDGQIECFDEHGRCIIFCTGADTIIAIEPLAYSLQRQSTKVKAHCDYIIVKASDPNAEPCILLVEIDPHLKHNLQELYEKMKTCNQIADHIIKTLVNVSTRNTLQYEIIKVIVVETSHIAGKTPEARTLAKQGLMLVQCWHNILSACQRMP